MRATRSETGQAAAELVAVVPLVVATFLAVAQGAVAGYALWSAGEAARAGARASLVEGEPRAAALSALPGFLEDDASVEVGERVAVEVSAPALVPGLPGIGVTASASLTEGADGG